MDPEEWNKLVTIRLKDGGPKENTNGENANGASALENREIEVGERPVNYYLFPPNAPTYAANYQNHCGL
jgi:hypothetical protein